MAYDFWVNGLSRARPVEDKAEVEFTRWVFDSRQQLTEIQRVVVRTTGANASATVAAVAQSIPTSPPQSVRRIAERSPVEPFQPLARLQQLAAQAPANSGKRIIAAPAEALRNVTPKPKLPQTPPSNVRPTPRPVARNSTNTALTRPPSQKPDGAKVSPPQISGGLRIVSGEIGAGIKAGIPGVGSGYVYVQAKINRGK